jgi:rhodanese-related sulfurtransferase
MLFFGILGAAILLVLLLRSFRPSGASLAPSEFQIRLSKEPKPLLVDVRSSMEYASGHLSGARLIPLQELARESTSLQRERPILLYCRSGHRSGLALRQLQAQGFQVQDLDGGMLAWEAQGLPSEK